MKGVVNLLPKKATPATPKKGAQEKEKPKKIPAEMLGAIVQKRKKKEFDQVSPKPITAGKPE